jgi:transposase
MRDYRIGCDAHKRYSQVEVQDDRGHVVRQARVYHEAGAVRGFFAQFPEGTPVALESVGNWYWIADEIEAAGCIPLLTHPAKAKVMIPRPSFMTFGWPRDDGQRQHQCLAQARPTSSTPRA